MKNLLPKLEELTPITNSNSTFYECGFNEEFSNLTEKNKLQIICDIVKETIYPNPFPNPDTELIDLNGNCHTACLVAMDYLKELNLCKDVKYVMVRRRKFDPEDITSIHAMLLVTGNDDVVYQFDPTPYVGYKFGAVEELSNPFYEEYVEVNDEMRFFIDLFKKIIYLDSINSIDKASVNEYVDICMSSLKYKILNGYAGNALKALLKHIEDDALKEKITELLKTLRPYSKTNIEKKDYQKELLKKQVDIWFEELKDLISSNKDIKRQLELSQAIVQELKMNYPENEIYRNIDGNDTRISYINPRFMYEHGFTTIMIKTSAYFLGLQDYIRNVYTSKYPYTGEYDVNLSKQTEQTGIKPMLFSHPLGETCIRALSGDSTVMLVKGDPNDVYKDKKYLRNSLCGDMWYKEFTWYDGKPIVWDPFSTNLIHGTDNSPEAALHYSIGNPEHQNMTRFMYPNPKLEYKRK